VKELKASDKGREHQLSEDDLLHLMRKGDEQAFLVLYRRHQGPIFRFALHMSGSRQIAEEVTQEVFLGLLSTRGRYDAERGSLQAYLIGVARNCVRGQQRRDRVLAPFDSSYLAEETSDRADLLALRKAILTLQPKYREVIVLCDLEELSYEEAARHLGCALGTVRSRLHRARAVLLRKMQGRRESCPA
jgi:RNA polymerase sigma-70 factor (ECF subfamily)